MADEMPWKKEETVQTTKTIISTKNIFQTNIWPFWQHKKHACTGTHRAIWQAQNDTEM
jgi:hypothetical protein